MKVPIMTHNEFKVFQEVIDNEEFMEIIINNFSKFNSLHCAKLLALIRRISNNDNEPCYHMEYDGYTISIDMVKNKNMIYINISHNIEGDMVCDTICVDLLTRIVVDKHNHDNDICDSRKIIDGSSQSIPSPTPLYLSGDDLLLFKDWVYSVDYKQMIFKNLSTTTDIYINSIINGTRMYISSIPLSDIRVNMSRYTINYSDISLTLFKKPDRLVVTCQCLLPNKSMNTDYHYIQLG